MTDALKLQAIADWFDARYKTKQSKQFQDDLRRIARELDITHDTIKRLNNDLQYYADKNQNQ